MTDLYQHPQDASSPEVGMMVVWPRSRHWDQQLLRVLEERFRILDVTEIFWTPERTLENYSRFYRSRPVPPHRSSLVVDKGRGPALVITLVDDAPVYGLRMTTGGERVVSTAMFDTKASIRAMSEGGPSLHSSDNPAETRRDMMMLLGRTLPSADAPAWDGVVRTEHRDVIGADGWATTTEFFRALDAAAPYVVLRNFEHLPHSATTPEHDDIDILTSSYRDIVAMSKAQPLTGVIPPTGGRFHVHIEGRPVLFDIRVVGDGYYDAAWEEEVLAGRTQTADGLWTPSGEEYFQTLLYHAVVHKPSVSTEYRTRLVRMATRLDDPRWDPSIVERDPLGVVRTILAARGFRMTRPRDPTVYFNHRAAGARHPRALRLRDAAFRRLYRNGMRWVVRPMNTLIRGTRERMLEAAPALRAVGRRARAAAS